MDDRARLYRLRIKLLLLVAGPAAMTICIMLILVHYEERAKIRRASEAGGRAILNSVQQDFETLSALPSQTASADLVSRLRAFDEVEHLWLQSSRNETLFYFSADGEALPLADLDIQALRFESGRMSLAEPIEVNGRIIGRAILILRVSDARILGGATCKGLAIAGALLSYLAVFGLVNAQIITPIQSLSELADTVRRSGDYSLRCDHGSRDELGFLADSFNLMLATISASQSTIQTEAMTATLTTFATLHSSQDGIVILDHLGTVWQYNDRFLEMWDATHGQVVRDDPSWLDTFVSGRLSIADAGEQAGFDWRVGDGGRYVISTGRTLEFQRFQFSDAKGRSTYLLVFRDITRRLELERQLQQAQKLEAIGMLAGGVAHDFNNVLLAIGGHASLAIDIVDGRHPAQAHLKPILAGVERATSLTRQLSTFSRDQTETIKLFDLNEVLSEVADLLGPVLGEDIVLSFDLAPEPCLIKADPNRIVQVVLNLGINARDAMPDGGRLHFKTRIVAAGGAAYPDFNLKQATFVDPASVSGSQVVLTVSDTGIGMDEETRSRIFDPFFTTKAVGQGTGLGLATSYGIVKKAGGEIAVESAVGRGTQFTVRFPRAHRNGHDLGPHQAPDRAEPASTRMETVLLVEDDAMLRDLLGTVLRNAGYAVLPAPNAATALQVHAQRDEPVDLIITDMVMPGQSGLAFADAVQRECRDMRILFMSGYSDDLALGRRIKQPDVFFLAKPFTPREFLAMVRRIVDSPAASVARQSNHGE